MTQAIDDLRPWVWGSETPPDALRPYVHKLAGGALAYSSPGALLVPNGVDKGKMAATAVLTTPAVDYVGDVVRPEGCNVNEYALNDVVFFGHQSEPIPVGRSSQLISENPLHRGPLQIRYDHEEVIGTCFFDQKGPIGTQYFRLVDDGIITAVSIGFSPISEPVLLQHKSDPDNQVQRPFVRQGHRYDFWKLLEYSWCGIGMNPQAGLLRSYLDVGKIAGDPISPMVRKSLEPLAAPKRADRPRFEMLKPVMKHDPKRWNKSLPIEFDVALEPSRPINTMYEWVARHIGVEIKHLFQNGTSVPSARMGSFLTGLKHVLSQYELPEVRNIASGDGREVPPVYKMIQLNSKQRDDFLIDGLAFYRGAMNKFAVLLEPSYYGESVTVFTSDKDSAFNAKILDDAWTWAKQNNFLKNEAFALSGEFLAKTSETWDDVFLEPENRKALHRTLDLFNKKGKSFANRGSILTGPPGTGKTISSRVLRNIANGTFIWVSARDFHYAGSFGGVSLAFEMAKELAPSILVMEDVDNWLHDTTIDFIKTEMDGIARSAGVWTILTTNFPERLPEALIDRPGRFHDVLHFAQPTKEVRAAMLAKWLPNVPESERLQAAAQTEGYSGAHVYELAAFAKMLHEQDEMDETLALREAIKKVEEQRDLITAIQLEGSHYKPRRDLYERAFKKSLGFTATRQSFVTKSGFTDSEHPHAPAGSPEGGQFTAKPGGGSSESKPSAEKPAKNDIGDKGSIDISGLIKDELLNLADVFEGVKWKKIDVLATYKAPVYGDNDEVLDETAELNVLLESASRYGIMGYRWVARYKNGEDYDQGAVCVDKAQAIKDGKMFWDDDFVNVKSTASKWGFTATNLRLVTKSGFDSSKHPHAPAGSPEGGQFTAKPGGAGGSKPKLQRPEDENWLTEERRQYHHGRGDTPFAVYDAQGDMLGTVFSETVAEKLANKHGGHYEFDKPPSDKPKQSDHRQKLQAARDAHKVAAEALSAARKESYAAEKNQSEEALQRFDSHIEAARKIHDNMEFLGEGDEEEGDIAVAYTSIEDALATLRDAEDKDERANGWDDLQSGVTELNEADDATPEHIRQAKELQDLLDEAEGELNEYDEHVEAMEELAEEIESDEGGLPFGFTKSLTPAHKNGTTTQSKPLSPLGFTRLPFTGTHS